MSNGVNVFGYNCDENDCYIINEYEAKAVRKIFEMVIECLPDAEILNWLKVNGYKNTRGNYYTKSAIYRFIKNRKYIVEYKYADGVLKYQEESMNNSNIKTLETQLKDTTKAINNIVYAIEKGMFNNTMIERMKNLEEQKKQLETQIKLEKVNNEVLDKDFIKFILEKFKTTQKDTIENKKDL